ncbi:MAG: glycosyltransferase [Alphaproteobacteria bacterium]|nr:glycosyltransferase [Alphaproteobacteria bacterium]
MIRPKISIITVVYNILEHRRKDCFIKMLNSIKSQNYGNIEHIVIDGNSNDGTKEFLKSLGVKFFSKKDNGIYDAMNNGIKKATGKYITFLNSDDYYFDENVISKSISFLQRTNADFSFGKTKYIDENENIIHGILQENPDIKNLFLTMPCSHQSMVIKTDVIKKYMFDTNFKIVGDYDLTLKLFLNKHKFVYISEYLVFFRIGGASSNIKNVHFETIKLYKKMFNDLKIKILNKDVKYLEYHKKISKNMAGILSKIVGFRINKKLSLPLEKTKKILIFGLPILKIDKAENYINFYFMNLIKILSIRWQIC